MLQKRISCVDIHVFVVLSIYLQHKRFFGVYKAGCSRQRAAIGAPMFPSRQTREGHLQGTVGHSQYGAAVPHGPLTSKQDGLTTAEEAPPLLAEVFFFIS